ncbi:hypothetical protein K438DRAFT_2024334 [Mycena galopus ATCC 62051]|nr:hypothetical protein K438DRAFT_2024334 [Mycena galopus ATCC 62051]
MRPVVAAGAVTGKTQLRRERGSPSRAPWIVPVDVFLPPACVLAGAQTPRAASAVARWERLTVILRTGVLRGAVVVSARFTLLSRLLSSSCSSGLCVWGAVSVMVASVRFVDANKSERGSGEDEDVASQGKRARDERKASPTRLLHFHLYLRFHQDDLIVTLIPHLSAFLLPIAHPPARNPSSP